MRKALSMLLALLLLVSVPQQALAQTSLGFTDMPHNWSAEALQAAVDNGLLKGHDNRLRPDDAITRAEAVTIINRAFGASKIQDITSFMDVTPKDWFYDEMGKAVAMKIITGSNGKLSPNSSITREEVFTILARAVNLRESSPDMNFLDLNELSAWAKEGTIGLINAGYLNGSNGYINPGNNITRAEFAQIMYNIIKNYIHSPGTYESIKDGNVMINTPGVTLKGVTITGDLIIGDGVGEGEVTLEDVNVEGRLLVRGGGENSIVIRGKSKVDTIIIVKIDGKVRILNETGEEIAVASVEGDDDVILVGKFKNVIIQSPGINVYANNTRIESVNIIGEGSTLIVDDKAKIEEVTIDAENVVIEGKGEVEQVDVTKNGSNAEITTPLTLIDVDKDADNVIGTGGETIKPDETYQNGTTTTQDAKPVEVATGGGSSGGGGSTGGGTPPIVRYTVNYSVVNGNGTLTASVGSGASVNSGTSVTFTATPATGYEIKEWKVNGTVVTGSSTLVRTISTNTTVTVEYKEIVVAPTMYTVTYSVIGTGGTLQAYVSSEPISSGTEVLAGSFVNFIAVPAEGYRVKAWSVNDEVIDWLVGNNVSRDMIGDVDFKVEFELINPAPTTYLLTYSVVGEGGELSTSYASGTSVPINSAILMTATPDEGYRVKGWTFNSQPFDSTNTVYSFTMTRDNVVTVEFEEIPATMYTVNFSTVGGVGNLYASVEGIGHIYDGNQVAEGTNVTFTADIPSGYEIKEWRYNGNLVDPGDNILIISDIGMDITVTVEFSAIPIYELTIYVGNTTSPTVTVKDSLNNNRPVVETISGNIFIYNLETGNYTVTIEKDGYYTETRNFTVPETNYVEVFMAEVLPGIVSVIDPPIIELNVGQDLPILPSTVDVVLDTDAVVTLGVTWNTDGFDKNSPENYVLGGTLTLTDGLENPQGLVALQLVDVFAAPNITLDITNSNILRFDFDVPIVWVGEKDITEIGTPEYTKLAFLQDLFSDPTLDASVLNEENIEIVYGVGYLQINLLEDAINRDLFWELDHPWGIYGGNGDGIYRKDVTADLSIFNNHLGLASESTAESFKLKFAANYNEYGLPDYDDVISGVWQTAEQRADDIDPVRTMPTYEAIFTNTNVLRIESNQPIYYLDGPMWAEVDKAMLLADLFGHGEDFRDVGELFDVDKVGITMEDTAFEIQLFSGVFDSDFFWNIDHPDGIDPGYDTNPYPLDKDGNGAYRRLNTLDLSIFYNSSWDYVEETVDYYLKLYVPFENGIGKYSEPVQAIWQTVAQSEMDDDPVLDAISPSFVGITSNPVADEVLNGETIERHIWIEEGDSIEFQITAEDDNLRRMKVAESSLGEVEGLWYYADADVYHGPTDILAEEDEMHGVDVSYSNGTWTITFGPEFSASVPVIIFELDFEDYAGNSWSDVETSLENRTFIFIPNVLDRTDLNAIKAEISGLLQAYYSPETWADIDTAMLMPESTQDEIDAKFLALLTAKENLYELLDGTNDKYTIESNSTNNPFYVLHNDRGTGIALVSATNGTFGTTTAFMDRIDYTPDPGFSGVDTFTYTIETAHESTVVTVTVTVEPNGTLLASASTSDGTEFGFYSDEGGVKVVIEDRDTYALYITDNAYDWEAIGGELDVTFNYFRSDDFHTKIIGTYSTPLTLEPIVLFEEMTTPLQALEIQDVNGVGVNEIEVGKTYTLVYDIVPSDTTDVVNPVWSITYGDATINSLGEIIANSPGEITVRVNPSNPELAYIYDDFTLHAYNMHTISAEIVEGTEYGTIEMSIDGTPIDNPSEVKEGTRVKVTVTPIDETIEVVEWYLDGESTPVASFSIEGPVDHDMVLGVKLFKPNTPPVAVDDEVEVNSGSTVLIDVLANDTDADGDGLLISGFTQGTNGVVTQEGGSIRYTPGNGFIGMDEFQYEISDGNGGTSSAFVRITVSPSGTLLGTGSYQGNHISFYDGASGLVAVLEGQVSTTAAVIDTGYDAYIGTLSMNNSAALIYLRGGDVVISRVVAIGQDAVESEHHVIDGVGTLTYFDYDFAPDDTIHIAYLDRGYAGEGSYNDLMYYNTLDKQHKVLFVGEFVSLGGADAYGGYVSDTMHSLAVDDYGNTALLYQNRSFNKSMSGTDTTYYLELMNPITMDGVVLESYYVTGTSNRFSNLDLTGGSDITAGYVYNGTSYTRSFDGATLTEY